MESRTIVLTGASDGVGKAAAGRLVADGHQVIAVGRTEAKMQRVADELGIDYLLADFADLADVRRLGDELLARVDRIDVLANNAGFVAGGERVVTRDGHEQTFQVNYLAPFLLTRLLMDRLISSRGAVINTSSDANRMVRLDLDDLESERRYGRMRAYSASKLLQLLFGKELSRRYRDRGVVSAGLHPGVIASGFGSGSGGVAALFRFPLLRRLAMQTPEQGADTLVWMAEGTPGIDWQPGGYYARRRPARANRQADDVALAERLWDRTSGMLGLD